jgi:hypothetical protein
MLNCSWCNVDVFGGILESNLLLQQGLFLSTAEVPNPS